VTPGLLSRATVPVAKCPGLSLGCIEILVVGRDWQPVPDVAINLIDGNQQVASLTDAEGLVRIEALEKKPYQVVLPEFDKTAARWEGSAPLPDVRLTGSQQPVWQSRKPALTAHSPYTLKPGESFRPAVARLGFLPEAVWRLEANRNLRRGRGQPWAKPGEVIRLPERVNPQADAEVGRIYVFGLLNVPVPVGLRFIHEGGAPRAGVPYLALVTTKSGSPRPVIEGTTDNAGFLETWVPEDAIALEVTLGEKDDVEVFQFDLQEYVPASEPDGLQLRLHALGYYYGDLDGNLGPATKEALAAFQEEFGLDITGEPDAKTLARLMQAYLS